MPSAINYPPDAWQIFTQMLDECTVWVTDENLEEHSATSEESTLERIGLVVHGTLVGSRKVLCFCQSLLKQFEIDDVNRYRFVHLIQDCGEDVISKVYEGTPVPDLIPMHEVKTAISAAASRKQITDKDRMGAGVWLHKEADGNGNVHEKLLLVGSHELAIYNGGWEHSRDPTAGKKIIDFGGCEQWYEFDKLGGYLAAATGTGGLQWCRQVFEELQAVLGRWDNWEHGSNDVILASALAVVTWLQTTWEFRPLIFVTGSTNTGKTTLLHDWFEVFYGNLAFSVDKPTEAGFRQFIENTAQIAAIDELEKLGGFERDKLQKTLRTSTRGGKIAKGTSNQKGMTFSLQHIVWCGAIETGLLDAADLNRYIVLSLKEIQHYTGRPTFQLPPDDDLRDLGQRCLAVAMATRPAVAQMAQALKTANLTKWFNKRVQEAYSLPVSLIAVLGGMDASVAAGALENLLETRYDDSQDVRDEEALMSEIMGATVRMSHGVEATVSRLIDDHSDNPSDSLQSLATHGIKVVGKQGESERRLFFAPSIVSRKLLRGTRFQHLKIEELMLRIPDAERSRQRMGASRQRGVIMQRDAVINFASSGSSVDNGESGESDDYSF